MPEIIDTTAESTDATPLKINNEMVTSLVTHVAVAVASIVVTRQVKKLWSKLSTRRAEKSQDTANN